MVRRNGVLVAAALLLAACSNSAAVDVGVGADVATTLPVRANDDESASLPDDEPARVTDTTSEPAAPTDVLPEPAVNSGGGTDPNSVSADFDFSTVDPLIADFVDRNGLNGAALVVVHRDFGIIDERFWGVFDAERVSMIASSSKMVAASVLLALDDAGQLDINAPIADVLPYAAGHPDITTAQLLSNSSGLPGLMATSKYPDYLCAFSHQGSLQECAEAILTTPSDDDDVVAPDTRFDYGGVQWQVAGAVAEAASGMSWAELVDQLIVQPCGLTNFAFNNPFSQIETAGFSHPPGFDNNPEVLGATANPNIEGGAYSTTTDYAALMLMHLRGGVCGDTTVVSQKALDMMHNDRIAEAYDGHAGSHVTGYGMGWWVDRMTGTISDPGAFGSVPILDLDDGYGMLLMTESSSGLAGTLADELLPLIDEAVAAALTQPTPSTSDPSTSTTMPVDDSLKAEGNGGDDGPDDCGHDDEDCVSLIPCCGDLITPDEYLSFLSIQEESPTGTDSGEWPDRSVNEWTGCTAGEAVIRRTVLGDAVINPDNDCIVFDGWWYSHYDDVWISSQEDLAIDYVVSLSEAERSGAANWSIEQRQRFVDDISNMVAVSYPSVALKSDGDVAQWRPPAEVECSYAYTVVEVKAEYNLSVDPAEYDVLAEMIATCVPALSDTYNWWRLRTGGYSEYSDRVPEPPSTASVGTN